MAYNAAVEGGEVLVGGGGGAGKVGVEVEQLVVLCAYKVEGGARAASNDPDGLFNSQDCLELLVVHRVHL